MLAIFAIVFLTVTLFYVYYKKCQDNKCSVAVQTAVNFSDKDVKVRACKINTKDSATSPIKFVKFSERSAQTPKLWVNNIGVSVDIQAGNTLYGATVTQQIQIFKEQAAHTRIHCDNQTCARNRKINDLRVRVLGDLQELKVQNLEEMARLQNEFQQQLQTNFGHMFNALRPILLPPAPHPWDFLPYQ